MKKIVSLLTVICLLSLFAFQTFAAYRPENNSFNEPTAVLCYDGNLGDGFTFTDIIIVDETVKGSQKTATLQRTIQYGSSDIAIIAFTATFYYTGSTVSVLAKAVTQTDTYNGWSYSQTSFIASGGTVTLEGKLTKLWIINKSFSMSLTCDVNGNISSS